MNSSILWPTVYDGTTCYVEMVLNWRKLLVVVCIRFSVKKNEGGI